MICLVPYRLPTLFRLLVLLNVLYQFRLMSFLLIQPYDQTVLFDLWLLQYIVLILHKYLFRQWLLPFLPLFSGLLWIHGSQIWVRISLFQKFILFLDSLFVALLPDPLFMQCWISILFIRHILMLVHTPAILIMFQLWQIKALVDLTDYIIIIITSVPQPVHIYLMWWSIRTIQVKLYYFTAIHVLLNLFSVPIYYTFLLLFLPFLTQISTWVRSGLFETRWPFLWVASY